MKLSSIFYGKMSIKSSKWMMRDNMLWQFWFSDKQNIPLLISYVSLPGPLCQFGVEGVVMRYLRIKKRHMQTSSLYCFSQWFWCKAWHNSTASLMQVSQVFPISPAVENAQIKFTSTCTIPLETSVRYDYPASVPISLHDICCAVYEHDSIEGVWLVVALATIYAPLVIGKF